jgi:hypothetical protein
MVKIRKSNSSKNRNKKGKAANRAKARRVNVSTPFETCSEQFFEKYLTLLILHRPVNPNWAIVQ